MGMACSGHLILLKDRAAAQVCQTPKITGAPPYAPSSGPLSMPCPMQLFGALWGWGLGGSRDSGRTLRLGT